MDGSRLWVVRLELGVQRPVPGIPNLGMPRFFTFVLLPPTLHYTLLDIQAPPSDDLLL